MNAFFRITLHFFAFSALTLVTQIGGIVYLFSLLVIAKTSFGFKGKTGIFFILCYTIATYVIVPPLASLFGREPVARSSRTAPANYLTVLLNRNYVVPEMNKLLRNAEKNLNKSEIGIRYLDANFPFTKGFPLLPHLSHSDGRKLDLSFVYENKDGSLSQKLKSVSGYGAFEAPKKNELNQTQTCLSKGFFQYDFPKYLTFGRINKHLRFSEEGTKQLIQALLKNEKLGKLFIEPHLKKQLNLADPRVRFQGCHSVRHDDHIHIQL